MHTNCLHVLPEIFSGWLCCANAVYSASRPGLELDVRSLRKGIALPHFLWVNSFEGGLNLPIWLCFSPYFKLS